MKNLGSVQLSFNLVTSGGLAFFIALPTVGCGGDDSHSDDSACEMATVRLGSEVDVEWRASLERAVATELSDVILSDDSVAFTAWKGMDENTYSVATSDGQTLFFRENSDQGWSYRWELGAPPYSVDPFLQSTYDEELGAGRNPYNTSYPEQGYELGDERLAFATASASVFPFMEARIASLFDSANAPDLVWSANAASSGGIGSHGGMSLAQSRAPLLMHGPGLVATPPNIAARVVDIAPTVAALLGVEPTSGQWDGRRATGLMLKRQDGRVLEELFDSECSYGSAERAVVFILDGLSHTALERGLSLGQLPNIGKLAGSGIRLPHGSIVGFPSFSLPGHVSVHTGAYPGSHGLLSNEFLDRSTGETAVGDALQQLLLDPVAAQRVSGNYLSPDVETMFEAVERSFPEEYTASINELTIRGAEYCRLNESTRADDSYLEYEVGDELALIDLDAAWNSRGAPKYLAISFYLTDAVGEGYGPHGDALHQALIETDERLGRVLSRYEQDNLFDNTLFVLTADHGMELQDSARSGNPASRIRDYVEGASIPSRGMVYLPY